jgi:hypothetical protein
VQVTPLEHVNERIQPHGNWCLRKVAPAAKPPVLACQVGGSANHLLAHEAATLATLDYLAAVKQAHCASCREFTRFNTLKPYTQPVHLRSSRSLTVP